MGIDSKFWLVSDRELTEAEIDSLPCPPGNREWEAARRKEHDDLVHDEYRPFWTFAPEDDGDFPECYDVGRVYSLNATWRLFSEGYPRGPVDEICNYAEALELASGTLDAGIRLWYSGDQHESMCRLDGARRAALLEYGRSLPTR